MLKYCKRHFRETGVLVVALLLPSGLWGQNPPAARTESIPTVQLRLRSLTELLNKAEYAAGLVDQAETFRAVKALIFLARLQGKGVEGIHPDRPFGLYAHVKPDLVTSSFVIMIPCADRDSLLNLLKGQLGCTVENQRENRYKLALPPEFPLMAVGIDHLYLRFERDYLYVGRFAEDLEDTRLIPAKTYFASDDDGTVLSLQVRLDQISVDVKKFLLAQLEMFLEQGMRDNPPEDDVGKRLAPWLKNHFMNLAQTVSLDAEEVSLRVYIDEKKGELASELRLTPKRGTLLAENLRAFAERKSLPAGIVQSAPQAAMRGGVHVGLTPLARREFAHLVQDIAAEAIKKATPDEREFVQGLFQAILPTLKAAELDAAAVLLPADRQGYHKLLGALGVHQGKEIEKFLKSIAPILTTVELADFSFDRETLGDFRIHKVIVNGWPERADQLFGTTTLWLAVSDRCLAWSIEENGELLRSALKKAQGVSVPLVDVEVSAAALLPVLAPQLHPDEIKAIQREVFGDKDGRNQDRIRLRITAGDQFTLKVEAQGPAIRLLHTADVLRP
ncbi:MAG: hypothetical protein N3E46_11015 [Gemmataceae bacterium]|nr:hypothetical protein [Gemmataceae bacterium]